MSKSCLPGAALSILDSGSLLDDIAAGRARSTPASTGVVGEIRSISVTTVEGDVKLDIDSF